MHHSCGLIAPSLTRVSSPPHHFPPPYAFAFCSLWVAQGSLSRNFRLGLVIGVMINIGVSSMSPAMQKDSAEKLADQITGGASGGGAAGGGSGGSSSGGGGLPSGPRVPVGLPDGAQLIGWRR